MFEVGVGATCMKPPFYAWSRSRPNLAGAGSGTSDFWSRSRPKKWRLRNPANCHNYVLSK